MVRGGVVRVGAAVFVLVLGLGLGLGACSRGGRPSDPPVAQDAAVTDASGSVPNDAQLPDAPRDLAVDPRADLAGRDLATGPTDPIDLALSADLRPPPDLALPRDLAPPADLTPTTRADVEIFVDNRCNMDVVPKVIDVPAGVPLLTLTYYNRSRDYAVNVDMSYGGSFLDLRPGMMWADRFEHCRIGRRPYSAYADIYTACSRYRLMINCK